MRTITKLSPIAAALLCAVVVSCKRPVTTDGEVKDIFADDERSSDRRGGASAEEKLYAIKMNGCTGHLIAPDFMMTANHCKPAAGQVFTSGAAANAGRTGDMSVAAVVESDANLDYAILAIQWAGGEKPTGQKFPMFVATRADQVMLSPALNQGDEIFTVGYPQDAESIGAIYAEGQLKEAKNNGTVTMLRYDMGIINGNSGGGVWRKKDGMLVSLTNGGAHNFGQAGWSGNDRADPNAWNDGAAMYAVYAASAKLQELYPNGISKFSNSPDAHRGLPSNGGGATDAGEIFVLLPDANVSALGAESVLISAPSSTAIVEFCAERASNTGCVSSSSGYQRARFVKSVGTRGIYDLASKVQIVPLAPYSVTTRKNDGLVEKSRVIQFRK